MSKIKEVVETKEVQETGAPVVEKKNDSAIVGQVVTYLKSKGADGATANDVAVHLGYMTQEQLDNPKENKDAIKTAGKKARKYLRDAVDKNGGKREVRDGRTKVYQII